MGEYFIWSLDKYIFTQPKPLVVQQSLEFLIKYSNNVLLWNDLIDVYHERMQQYLR